MKRYGKFLIWFSVFLFVAGSVACYFAFTEYDFYKKLSLYNAAQDIKESGETLKRLAEIDGNKVKAAEYEEKIKEAAKVSLEYWEYHIKAEYEREPNWIFPTVLCASCYLIGFSFLMTGIFVFSLGSHQEKLLKELKSIHKALNGKPQPLDEDKKMPAPLTQAEIQKKLFENSAASTASHENKRTRRSRTSRVTSAQPNTEWSSDTPDKQ